MEKIRKIFNSWYLFIPRLILWVVGTFIVPIALIMNKFKVFEYEDGEKLKFNGWTIIVVMIIAIGVFYLLKYVLKAMTFNYISQIINGFISLILWLILAYSLVVYAVKFQEQILFILKWSIVSCSLSVLVNPLPRWEYNRKNKDIAISIGTYLNKRS